jgi:hypothetical protein
MLCYAPPPPDGGPALRNRREVSNFPTLVAGQTVQNRPTEAADVHVPQRPLSWSVLGDRASPYRTLTSPADLSCSADRNAGPSCVPDLP